MRTLLSNSEKDSTTAGIYPRYQSVTEGTSLDPASSSFRYDSAAPGQSLQIKREDLSPVSRFREENLYARSRPPVAHLLGQSKRKEPLLPFYEPQPRVLSINKKYTDPPSRPAAGSSTRYESYNFSKNFSSTGVDSKQSQSLRRSAAPSSYASSLSTKPAAKLSGGYTYDPVRNKYQTATAKTKYRIEYSDDEDDKVY